MYHSLFCWNLKNLKILHGKFMCQNLKMSFESNVIEVFNIPQKHFNFGSIYSHFKRYGHIQSLYLGNSNHSTIIYETCQQARRAVYSTQAFAGDRFVEIRFSDNPIDTPANLIRSTRYYSTRKWARKVLKSLKDIKEKNMLTRYRLFQLQDGSTVAQLQFELDSLLAQGEERVKLIDQLSGFERDRKINELISIAKRLKEIRKVIRKEMSKDIKHSK